MSNINDIIYTLFESGSFDGSYSPKENYYVHVDGEATIRDPRGINDFNEANSRVRVGNLGKGNRVTKNIGYYESSFGETMKKLTKRTIDQNFRGVNIFGSKSLKQQPQKQYNTFYGNRPIGIA